MKIGKCILIIFTLVFLTSGCTAHLVGKFDDYNEIFTGTVLVNGAGQSVVNAKSEPSGITCKGHSVVTYVPFYNFILPICKGQRGYALMTCSDNREIKADWEILGFGLGKVQGTGFDSYNNKVSFYFDTKKKKSNKVMETYKKELLNKPLLPKQNGVSLKKSMSKYYY